jgi:hypothetical protein
MAIFTVIATLLLIVVININNKVVLTVKSVIHSLLEITLQNVLTLKINLIPTQWHASARTEDAQV